MSLNHVPESCVNFACGADRGLCEVLEGGAILLRSGLYEYILAMQRPPCIDFGRELFSRQAIVDLFWFVLESEHILQ